VTAVPCTYALGRLIELGNLPRQRDGLGTDNLLMVPAKSIGSATDAILRNCRTWADLLAAGVQECNFTGYTAGGKVLGPSDVSTGYVTGSSPYKAQLSIPTPQLWNPAGGAVNNLAIPKVFLLYRPTPSTLIGSCLHLGMNDAAGGASGTSFSHTFGTLTSQAT